MSATVLGGPKKWSGARNEDGERTYKVTYQVQTSASTVGPSEVFNAAGLPAVGTAWNIDGDTDDWAFRTSTTTVKMHSSYKNEKGTIWLVELTFSTRQPERCNEQDFEDPLSEPQKISGSFVKYVQEITKDRNDELILNSAHELIRGAIMEFDHNRPTVQIGQNVSALGLETFTEMVDTVNDSTLWGLSARKVKLSNVSWTRNTYGLCYVY